MTRARLRRQRARSMARRPREEGFSLSPRARLIAGWVAAAAVLGGIALGVRLVGGTGDGVPTAATASPSAPATDLSSITFGTALDPATGLVATAARTTRFDSGETFSYSVRELPARTVYVEVERIGDGPLGVVQPPSVQTVAADAPALAFTVPVDALLEAFGPGEYRMRMYLAAEGPPFAEGIFVLVGAASPAP